MKLAYESKMYERQIDKDKYIQMYKYSMSLQIFRNRPHLTIISVYKYKIKYAL